MDKLNHFLLESYRSAHARPQEKVASATSLKDPTALEKWAYGMAFGELGQDQDFLSKFEGTPLAPQAIALAEQELAMESRHLQKRMQRDAQRQMDESWQQECNEKDGLRLQKQQLQKLW
jgi:hypothetical protein